MQCRRTGEAPAPKLRRWLDALAPKLRGRLIAMDLIDRRAASADKPLTVHLEGGRDAGGNATEPGFRQALEARGVTAGHVHTTCKRVGDLLDACGFVFWPDLTAPGAEARVEVHLGRRRDKGEIGGPTLNYSARDFRGFCPGAAPAVGLPGRREPPGRTGGLLLHPPRPRNGAGRCGRTREGHRRVDAPRQPNHHHPLPAQRPAGGEGGH